MRRFLLLTFTSAAVLMAGCSDQPTPEPLGPDEVAETLDGKKPPADCLSESDQQLADDIREAIDDLFIGKGGKTPAIEQLNNIERKLCEEEFADALEMAWGFLGLITEKIPDEFSGDATDASALASDVFALVGSSFEIPEGAFDPETGGIHTFDPDEVTLPFVAGTGNNEAAVVLDEPGIFPPGTGEVTIVLSRSDGDLVTTFGAYIPGFQAFEEGYQIISSHQPLDLGPGILVAICGVPSLPGSGVPPLPEDAPLGHLHEGAVSLLVPTDPDPQELGYIDCSNVDPTTTIPEISWNSDAGGANPGGSGWMQLARRAVEPVARLLAPPPLNAEMLAVGPGLGGRTKSLSRNAPVDPVIEVDDSVELQAGFDATWTSADEGIATVEGFGGSATVTGVCPGTTSITAAFGEESSLSIRITVEGEGGEGCDSELPEPILEQTGAGPGDGGVIYDLTLTNASDYAALFDAEAFPSCTEGTDAPLFIEIWDTENEVPEDEFCVESLDDLESFTLHDSQADVGDLGDYEDIFVILYDVESGEPATSNIITLVPWDGCPC